jgi:hypothetical protein
MSNPQVCMFCRYKKSRARDAAACCAGAEVLQAQADRHDGAPPLQARGMPERLRHPPPKPYPAPR